MYGSRRSAENLDEIPERSRLSNAGSFSEINRSFTPNLSKNRNISNLSTFSTSALNWGSFLILLSALMTTIAILTPYWIQNEIEPSLAKVGLWIKCAAWRGDERYQVIREGNRYYQDMTNSYRADLSGECGLIFGYYDYPVAFLVIQLSFTIYWIILLLTGTKALWFVFCVVKSEVNGREDFRPLRKVGITFLIAGFLGSTALVFFGTMSERWIPASKHNYISWSYWLAVFGVIAQSGGALLLMTN